MDNIKFEFDYKKSSLLRKQRGIGFEEIITLIESGRLIAIIAHPKPNDYPNQEIYLLDIENYIWLVPHIKKNNIIRLITYYPSRKATKQWLKENQNGKK